MKNIFLVAGLIIIAALSRLLPHPDNVTPIGSMALLGGALIGRKNLAFTIPFFALFISDFILNNTLLRGFYPDQSGIIYFTQYMIWTYTAFGIIVLLGLTLLRKLSFGRLLGVSLISSTIFFLITNLGIWIHTPIYAKNLGGLSACYAAALPFFRTSIFGDLFFISLLYGAFYFISTKVLKTEAVRSSY